MRRHLIAASLVFATCLAVLEVVSGPVRAGGNKNNDEARLRAQIKKLEQDARQDDAKIRQLQGQLQKANAEAEQDARQAQKLQQLLKQREQQMQQLLQELKKSAQPTAEEKKQLDALKSQVKQLELVTKAGYVHTMLLKLKPDAPEAAVNKLVRSVPAKLDPLPGVRAVWAGKAAKEYSDTYQVGIVVLLDNAAAMQKLSRDAAYLRFTEELKKDWESPRVFDFLAP